MSESALEAPRADQPPAGDALAPASLERRSFARRHIWWGVAVALLAVAVVLILWARTRPSYDAYGWLVWGYQSVHGALDLGGAPSWKPLPFLFTVPYALFGRAELWLWMLTAVTLSLAGAVFGARLAYRLTLTAPRLGTPEASLAIEDVAPVRRYAALAAAVFAGLAVLGLEDYMHYILSVQSDPIIVTCTLGAIDCHLNGRRRWAFAFALLASLGRPEAWPWLGLYSLWAWRRVPSMRWLIVAGMALLAFMWFGIPWITNGRPFVSAQLAFNSPRELKQNQVFGTIGRFKELQYAPAWIAALVCVGIAWWRRNWLVLSLAAGAVGWVVVEIAFALHGWPGLPRYMFEPAAVSAVLAGVAVGWVLLEAPRLTERLPRLSARTLRWVGAAAVVVLVAAMIPGALGRLRTEHRDLRHERHRATEIVLLGQAIDRLGWPESHPPLWPAGGRCRMGEHARLAGQHGCGAARP